MTLATSSGRPFLFIGTTLSSSSVLTSFLLQSF